jgi:hypothetical protein
MAHRLFAPDQNFPQPMVEALSAYMPEATLVSLWEIDPRLAAEMEDWEVMVARNPLD